MNVLTIAIMVLQSVNVPPHDGQMISFGHVLFELLFFCKTSKIKLQKIKISNILSENLDLI
jgi:hypothetical protein